MFSCHRVAGYGGAGRGWTRASGGGHITAGARREACQRQDAQLQFME